MSPREQMLIKNVFHPHYLLCPFQMTMVFCILLAKKAHKKTMIIGAKYSKKSDF